MLRQDQSQTTTQYESGQPQTIVLHLVNPDQVQQPQEQQQQQLQQMQEVTQHEEQPKPIIKNAKAKKPKNTSRVQWREDTVDNEGLNKLKSNLCCIYHNPHESADLSPSTCSSDDAGNELDRDRKTKKRHLEVCSKRKNKDNNHENCGSGHKH